MKITVYISNIIIAISAAMIVASCGASRSASTATTKSVGGSTVSSNQSISISSGLPVQSQALLREASGWLGTPYKYGGNDRGGVDCSGLVKNVYDAALSISMPRNSKAQSDYCTPARKEDLIPGDLLFFATGSGRDVSHVGIFIGDNRMIHSSTSRGVIISDINSDYYMRTYKGSGRVEKYHAMIDTKNLKIPSTTTPTTSPRTTTAPLTKSTLTISLDDYVAAVHPSDSIRTSTEISTADARESVLNSIIEQKLDSIYCDR